MRRRNRMVVVVGAVVFVFGGLIAPAAADDFIKGPDPTEASVTAARGPFAVATIEVPKGSGPGFNNGTISYPTTTSDGTFGAVAVVPGFVEGKAAIDWFGPRLASQGFVVMTLNTDSIWDSPYVRGNQLLAALDYLTGSSAVKNRIDPARLAVVGHSMGGGGTLDAAAERPTLKAAVALAPWHAAPPLDKVRTPTMIFGSDNDFIAPAGSFAKPFHDGLSQAPEKAYLRLNKAGHMTYTSPDKRVAEYTLSWLKRYVDDDVRYSRFLCPGPSAPSAGYDAYQATCPM